MAAPHRSAVFLALAAQAALQEPAPFRDPAPPEVHTPKAGPPLVASPTAELTRHASPRALAEDAVTEGWPCFRGPRGDGRSLETHLRLDWDAAGPTLLTDRWRDRTGVR